MAGRANRAAMLTPGEKGVAMPPKLVAFVGSPRPGGNTDTLADAALSAFAQAGGEAEKVILNSLSIRPCQGCLACMRGDGLEDFCAVRDDMQGLHRKLLEADALLWATPVYMWSPSAQMKTFLDRLFPFGDYQKTRWRAALAGKPVGLAIVYADPDPLTSGVVQTRDVLRAVVEASGGRVAFVVHTAADQRGDVARNAAVLERMRAAASALFAACTPAEPD